MPIDRDVLEAVREMDEHELRRLLILAKARLDQHGVALPDGASPKVGAPPPVGQVRQVDMHDVSPRAVLVCLLA